MGGGWARRGTLTVRRAKKKQQSADQTDEPPPKLENSTGPSDVSYRRAMQSAGPKAVVVPPLSLPYFSRALLVSCVLFLSECRGAEQTRGIYAENGARALRGVKVEEEAVGGSRGFASWPSG